MTQHGSDAVAVETDAFRRTETTQQGANLVRDLRPDGLHRVELAAELPREVRDGQLGCGCSSRMACQAADARPDAAIASEAEPEAVADRTRSGSSACPGSASVKPRFRVGE